MIILYINDDMFYLLAIVMICITIALGIYLGYSEGFKAGQISSLTGDIQYELTINQDSTRTWKKIEKEE
jgi:hypothetical protein